MLTQYPGQMTTLALHKFQFKSKFKSINRFVDILVSQYMVSVGVGCLLTLLVMLGVIIHLIVTRRQTLSCCHTDVTVTQAEVDDGYIQSDKGLR